MLDFTKSLVEDLCQLIHIPTVYQDQEIEGQPFGPQVRQGFEWVRKKAQAFGFSTKDFDGYALQIDVGEGERIIGMLCHVDVVPAGEGWDTDPFDAQVIGGNIYGRGAVDDKGPLICCLYAAKYIVEKGLLPPGTKLRLIIGGDEEGSWRCIEHYKQHAETPEIAFAADGMFPLVFGEKGLVGFDLIKPLCPKDAEKSIKLLALQGGSARNSVPSQTTFTLCSDDSKQVAETLKQAAETHDIQAEITRSGHEVTCCVTGIAAHAMFPERGKNSIAHAMRLLTQLGHDLDAAKYVEFFNQYISEDYSGERFGCKCSDEASGPLTMNPGKIQLDQESIILQMDIRYPISEDFDKILAAISRVGEKGNAQVVMVDHLEPVCFQREDKVVRLMEQAYRTVTGDSVNQPFTVGAASYARAMKNTVAFGPIFPGQKEMSHLPNEFISIDDLEKTTRIYIEALKNLINNK